ncbi:MAG: hypothetical protein IPK20_21565 [Betaproteobacteria bacterium]|nr:hypothetical protein [Betaproteobacteria bacterium]
MRQQTPAEVVCFESRKGASEVSKGDPTRLTQRGKCFSGPPAPRFGMATRSMARYPCGKMPGLVRWSGVRAVVKPRSEKLMHHSQCGTACHNGVMPKGFPKDNRPVPIPTMEAMVPDVKNLQHGRGRIWKVRNCHHKTQRNKLVDHFGEPIKHRPASAALAAAATATKLRDWRDGIYGKRIGEFTSEGKKRWFVCTECHNSSQRAGWRTQSRLHSALAGNAATVASWHDRCRVREVAPDRSRMADELEAPSPGSGETVWVPPRVDAGSEQTRRASARRRCVGLPWRS